MVDANPDSRTYTELCDKAEYLMDVNRHAEAVRLLTDAVRVAPDAARAYIHLAWCHRILKNPSDSLKCVNRAVEAEPESAWAHRVRSLILFWLDKPVAAFEAAAQALNLDIDDVQSIYVYGLTALHAERNAETQSAIERLFLLAPDWYSTHELLGWANFRWKRPREAERAFREALARNPESAELQNIIGELCRESGRVHEGTQFFESSLRLDPTNRQVQQSLRDSQKTLTQNDPFARTTTYESSAGLDFETQLGVRLLFIVGFILVIGSMSLFVFVLGAILLGWLFFFFRVRGYNLLKWPSRNGETPTESKMTSGKFLNLK
jgi:tetratricopeptide (TPR) repeat protein